MRAGLVCISDCCDTICALKCRASPLGRGAKAAHQTLDLWILVRIQAPQPIRPYGRPAKAGLLFYRLAVLCKMGFVANIRPAIKSYFVYPLRPHLHWHQVRVSDTSPIFHALQRKMGEDG